MEKDEKTQTRSEKVNAEIVALLKARHTLLWVTTREELRVERAIVEAAALAKYEARFWDCAGGVTDAKGKQLADERDPSAMLDRISTSKERVVYVLRDLHKWFDAVVLRSLRNLAKGLQSSPAAEQRTIVILTPISEIPPELAGHVTVLDYPLPDRREIERLLNDTLDSLSAEARSKAAPNGTLEAAIDAAIGLSSEEAANCFAKSLVTLRCIDPQAVAGEKKKVITRERVLTWHDPDPRGLDAVGGLDLLKAWLKLRRSAFSAKAREYGLPAPRGMLLLGHSGTGKSLTAKCVAAAWGMPLLRLDMGALRSKWVGDSEQNIRRALKVAEAISPCVTAGTLIALADGREVPALDLFERGTTTIPVRAFDEATGLFTTATLLGITRKPVGDHGCFQIETPAGAIERTGNHRLWTRRGWVAVSDLVPGTDWIAFTSGAASADETSVSAADLLPDGIRTMLDGTYRLGRGGWTDSVLRKLPDRFDCADAYLLGLCMSDGSIRERMVEFRSSDDRLIAWAKARMTALFGVDPAVYDGHGDGYVATKEDGSTIETRKQVRAVRLANRVAWLTFEAFKERLLTLPRPMLASWMRGFIQGDGSVLPESNRVVITQVGERQRVVTAVLRRLGFHRRFCGKNLTVSGHDEVSRLLDLLRAAEGCPDDKVGTCGGVAPTQWTFTRGVERDTALDITWGRVANVEPMPEVEWVYDLHCDGPHTYCGDGAIDHNCVLWLDELEKSLGGSTGPQGDGGVAADALGAILNWMQERQGSVFVVATANDVSALPPELLRKGRFDEIFFVDLPTENERLEILSASLKQYGREVAGVGLALVAAETNGFTGAEIAGLIPDALFTAFNDGARMLTSDDLLAVVKTVVPLSKMASEKVEGLRKWAKGRARPASLEQEETKSGRVLDM